jgi:hypothetical protein
MVTFYVVYILSFCLWSPKIHWLEVTFSLLEVYCKLYTYVLCVYSTYCSTFGCVWIWTQCTDVHTVLYSKETYPQTLSICIFKLYAKIAAVRKHKLAYLHVCVCWQQHSNVNVALSGCVCKIVRKMWDPCSKIDLPNLPAGRMEYWRRKNWWKFWLWIRKTGAEGTHKVAFYYKYCNVQTLKKNRRFFKSGPLAVLDCLKEEPVPERN